jgi:ppGpp synthetase/RelA/SpoT-type nucleotidyltranferase
MQLCNDDIRFIEEYFPEPYNTPETFGDYLLPKIQHHDTLCTAVIAEVKKSILHPLMKKYHYRFFCRIDADHKIKQPSRIIDKLIPSSEAGAGKAGPKSCTLDNFTTTMKDLARFRTVCNFIHDVEEVVEALQNSEFFSSVFRRNIQNLQREKNAFIL